VGKLNIDQPAGFQNQSIIGISNQWEKSTKASRLDFKVHKTLIITAGYVAIDLRQVELFREMGG
jgi:hypothetical protein